MNNDSRPGGRLDLASRVAHRKGQRHSDQQLTFDGLGPELIDVTFVVVDLETIGAKAGANSITEIGAVKVRGGEVISDFSTLVNPRAVIPPFITALTGISQAMVATAPGIEEALPAFFAFVGSRTDTVLVAHNARFDVGQLRGAAEAIGYPFPKIATADTLALARKAFTKDEVRNYKLSTLAAFIGAETSPTHRALDDARATVDLLHAILARLGGLGVTHLADLATAADPVPAKRRAKAHLADGLPRSPGVYKFIGPGGDVLYVGTSRNVYSRVRSYFTAAEKRKRIAEMVDIAVGVEAIATATVLEANVLEVRLIDELDPPYNRRSKRSQSRPWVMLTEEPHPRLKVARKITLEQAALALGPFGGERAARATIDVLNDATGLRSCTLKIPADGGLLPCHLAELGKCTAPCIAGDHQTEQREQVCEALSGAIQPVTAMALERVDVLAGSGRFEQAAEYRDRIFSLVRGGRSREQLVPVLAARRICAAHRVRGGWEIIVTDYGRLRGSVFAPDSGSPRAAAQALMERIEPLEAPQHATAHAPLDETQLIARWLWQEGTRLIEVDSDTPLAMRPDGATSIILPERDDGPDLG
ncbi:DNA polymerase-3 subunit epsilon [Arcanobacterium wilhelmae]|uniref:DNA polymerase-3 subunit epsilon n=1 Tax=Arcanobacterium wilhelmae TaxID=1803177 RepID=A0ABT9N8Z5_9ACTO|nr:DEDD exonuclease domain-containing protein [Arcanobacterium wilhelmae]MDP9800177.1 DNA polymerase-3 subunit epsilon [Arcanobacterium wilhelmae]WFN89618.1 DEDD exonuclease domain-containing protein [Arcanobacterium wilhelmae]